MGRTYSYLTLQRVMHLHIEKLISFAERRFGERLKVEIKHTDGRGCKHIGILSHKGVRSDKPVLHKLVFGSKCLKHYSENGYKEYKSLQWMMRGKLPMDTHAIYYIVTHEFAHAIQTRWGIRTYGSVHNDSFVKMYQLLLSEMPFDGSHLRIVREGGDGGVDEASSSRSATSSAASGAGQGGGD